jgi:hypothetical protein
MEDYSHKAGTFLFIYQLFSTKMTILILSVLQLAHHCHSLYAIDCEDRMTKSARDRNQGRLLMD